MQDQSRTHLLPRLHLAHDPDAPMAEGVERPMAPEHAHYLGGVLRRGPGDAVRLFNATDGEWLASIAALRKERGSLAIGRRLRAAEPEAGPTLLFAPLKRDATDLVVRMATELGAVALRPVLTERTNAARINAERWRAIATEAAEQCERLGVPEIGEPVRLAELLGGWDTQRPLLAALERDERAAATPIATWRASHRSGPQPGLLVGPEGGFSGPERALLLARGFVVPVGLGRLILRAETAAVAGLASLLS